MNLQTYPIRILYTRTKDESDKLLEQLLMHLKGATLHTPAERIELADGKHIFRAITCGELSIFVVNTDRTEQHNNPRGITYSVMKHFRKGCFLYVCGSVLGIMPLRDYHNFPVVVFGEESDALAYFSSGVVGESQKELNMCWMQRLSYLMVLEDKPKKEANQDQEDKPVKKERKEPKEQKARTSKPYKKEQKDRKPAKEGKPGPRKQYPKQSDERSSGKAYHAGPKSGVYPSLSSVPTDKSITWGNLGLADE